MSPSPHKSCQVVENSDLAFHVPYFAAQTQGALEAGEGARVVSEPPVALGQASKHISFGLDILQSRSSSSASLPHRSDSLRLPSSRWTTLRLARAAASCAASPGSLAISSASS